MKKLVPDMQCKLNNFTFRPELVWHDLCGSEPVNLCDHAPDHRTRIIVAVAEIPGSFHFATAVIQQHTGAGGDIYHRITDAPRLVMCDTQEERDGEYENYRGLCPHLTEQVKGADRGSPMAQCPTPSKIMRAGALPLN